MDSCAGGGGRNDIESLRRGVPMLRSDFDRTTTALRLSISHSFNRWVPFNGAANKEKNDMLNPDGVLDEYTWRASYLAAMNIASRFVYEKPENFPMLRWGLKEYDTVRNYLLKDFYVHTPWHSREDMTGFTAFSYIDPEKNEGVITAFRQESCDEDTLTVTLPYVAPNTVWSLRNADTGEIITLSSNELTMKFPRKRTSKLFYIRKEN